MTVKYGNEAKLYYSVAGIANPNWVEADTIKSASCNVEGKEVDLTCRADAFDTAGIARMAATIEGEMNLDPADAHYVAMETAYMAKNPIGIACMSGGIAVQGSRGLWADCLITKFDRDESADGAQTIKLTLKPTRSATAAAWHIVA
jgi:hypothetical protein